MDAIRCQYIKDNIFLQTRKENADECGYSTAFYE